MSANKTPSDDSSTEKRLNECLEEIAEDLEELDDVHSATVRGAGMLPSINVTLKEGGLAATLSEDVAMAIYDSGLEIQMCKGSSLVAGVPR